MIYIKIFNINNTNDQIQVSIETTLGNKITSLRLWNNNNYKKSNEGLDLNYKLQNINNKEVFTITTSDASVSNFSGIFFLEIKSDSSNTTCTDCSNSIIAVTANFNNIKQCMLDKLLKLSSCDDVIIKDLDCNNNTSNILNISLLLDGLKKALSFGYYIDSISIYNSLLKLCNIKNNEKCNYCNSIDNPNLLSSLGYGTLNNTLVLI